MRASIQTPMLSKDELLDIGNTILETSTSGMVRIQIQQTMQRVTRVANNRVLTSDNGVALNVTVRMGSGSRLPVRMDLNLSDKASIQQAVRELDALARAQFGSSRDNAGIPTGPQSYLPVSLWHDSTAAAISAADDAVVPGMLSSLRNARLSGAGFLGMMARSTLVMQRDGLLAFNQETDSECSVSARAPDGRSSGWYGQADRDWSKIDPRAITVKAIEIGQRAADPAAVEPGRKTTILSSCALAQILRHVARHFDAVTTNVYKATAFAVQGDRTRANKIGLRVFDPRISITSNPADPLGGFIPFGDMMSDSMALPLKEMTWVEDGILRDLAYGISYGLDEGKPFSQNPWGMRFEAKFGTPLKTVEEMIASCEEGIYVNRLSDVRQLDARTGLQTGVTRDGCFLIRNGKIDKPIKNFRFTDSPFFFLNNIVAIGKSQRAAMGYTRPEAQEPEYAREWPRRPMIVPPVMVRDFNFTSLSDAV